MKCHLMFLGYKVWRSVEKEYKILNNLPIDRDELDQYEGNAKALNAILSGCCSILVCNSRHKLFVNIILQ